MFDNVCKFLAENFSEDYATWLLGRPVTLTKLSPTELSLEPIRADSLILEQSEDLVLHLEFQTEPDENMGFRMLDYRVRVYRRFPNKTMHQFVIYLKPTKSTLVYQDSFQLGETISSLSSNSFLGTIFRVISKESRVIAPSDINSKF